MYIAIRKFIDLEDESHEYNAGDTYPREGFKPSRERIIELASSKNKCETPLIAFIEDEQPTEPINEDEQPTVKKSTRKSKSE